MNEKAKKARREAGVMLPISSLPSRYGIGDLGPEAYRYVDMLTEQGIRYWQILPINPLGFGNSPYQPYSSFAGDPVFISPDMLREQGLLKRRPRAFEPDTEYVHFEAARAYKEGILKTAFEAFEADEAFEAFTGLSWVRPFAVFMTFKRLNQNQGWLDWPEAQKNWPQKKGVDISAHDAAIRYEMFLQYVFFAQWTALKAYANARGVEIIGDIPIYVGIDSLDVWMARENFLLEADGSPTFVAGVPPDYFSETGQRWGNPLYDWAHMQQDGFTFWLERFRASMQLFDVIRIDHFRGFDTYWEIPASCPTAVEGTWKEAPGYALFDKVMEEMPDIRIIAEDLGMLRDEVYQLRDHYHFPGMKIIQFVLEPGERIDLDKGARRMVVYTGTHDNQTIAGWYRAQPARRRRLLRRSLREAGYRWGSVAGQLVRLALDDRAELCVIPAADIIELSDEARINTPGTVGSPNWEWKLRTLEQLTMPLERFGAAARKSGRAMNK